MTEGRPVPWTRRDVIVVVALNVAGLAVIVAGWAWASGRTVLADQFPATDLAVIGLIVAGAGNIAWLLANRRAIGRARRSLLGSWMDEA